MKSSPVSIPLHDHVVVATTTTTIKVAPYRKHDMQRTSRSREVDERPQSHHHHYCACSASSADHASPVHGPPHHDNSVSFHILSFSPNNSLPTHQSPPYHLTANASSHAHDSTHALPQAWPAQTLHSTTCTPSLKSPSYLPQTSLSHYAPT
ncbi:hypothetical protein TcWFU_010354 [Taenia crassiceps]|uniref:Uncharacterized protein n=1 Tax=Taenia crassiceps TaxID=6207 RepID=A0ABR4QUW2_9CEST